MDEIEDPLEMCSLWCQHTVPLISPLSLSTICVRKVKTMLKMYPVVTDESERIRLMKGLRGLFDIPQQFVLDFQNTLLDSMKVADKIWNLKLFICLLLSIYVRPMM